MIPFIDLKAQYSELKEEIGHRIQTVLDHGQFIMGPEVTEAEEGLAEFVGSKFAITCSSGTDSTLLAMMALGVGPGDEVIIPAFSFIATAETVFLTGAKAVYVDIDPVTYNMNPSEIEKAFSEKTKAIMPVSLYGLPANFAEINKIADAKGVPVIEDAAQSFGSSFHGKRSCNLTTLGCTSFFPAKPLGVYGDGGALFTNDEKLAHSLKQLRFHGQESRYHHVQVGINGRMDTLQCAILIPKLKKFSWELDQRNHWASELTRALIDNGVQENLLPQVPEGSVSCWAQYTMRVQNRDQFQKRMAELNVPTAVHYPTPMPDQPAYKNLGRCLDIPETRQACAEVVSLPMHPYMKNDHIEQIANAVKKSLAN